MNSPSSAAASMMRELRAEVRQHLRSGRVIVAVDGTPGSGQAEAADALAAAFVEDGATVLRASASDFVEPGTTGHLDPDQLRRLLIEPFRAGSPSFSLAPTGEPATAPSDAVLIVDGDYLLGRDLRGMWNWSVWLEVHPTAAFARLAREGRGDADPAAESNASLRDAAAAYRRASNPSAAASALIENTDPENPTRIFGDFC
ncbi:hypothetical protein ACFXQA_00460 [Microbacterium sp. P07]|uniref:hypothetical protein n=1 Tax=Microbacterium sp. P07 TaxID=3366952 RepID=UPI003746CC38